MTIKDNHIAEVAKELAELRQLTAQKIVATVDKEELLEIQAGMTNWSPDIVEAINIVVGQNDSDIGASLGPF